MSESREYRLRRRYGIGVAEYNRLLAEQNGVCAICAKPEKEEKHGVLCVDHLHCRISPRVRGLLCGWCNKHINDGQPETELGDACGWHFHEQPDRLQAYAENPPATWLPSKVQPGGKGTRWYDVFVYHQFPSEWKRCWMLGNHPWWYGKPWLPNLVSLADFDAWYRQWLLTAADYLRRNGWIQVRQQPPYSEWKQQMREDRERAKAAWKRPARRKS